MVVVLALFFLFAGIASVVLLHLFVAARALRLRRRSSEGAGSGLSRADLKRIPCFSFRGGGDRAGSDSGCAVCLEGFKKGDRCRVLPGCRHCFHKGCVDKWLVKTRACPLCRRVLSTIYTDIEVLFSDLSVSNIESILASYLNESFKLLDIYNRHHLLIRLVIHLLSSSSDAGEVKLRCAMLETERSER
ncbi:hypothetical protein QJS10_CPB17g00122 [Acorus calamus]|uniref:RING-type domain-containing protein n=1 Tax=Acorus calamus TaxID=4465 RepID=A0AAV9CWN3_ACOCL|nr:hypothetical protein QJS10_CPB17g00122 [Acorus calamus]